MTATETLSILEAAQKLLGLSNAQLFKLAADPKRLLVLADIVKTSQKQHPSRV